MAGKTCLAADDDNSQEGACCCLVEVDDDTFGDVVAYVAIELNFSLSAWKYAL